MWRRPLLTTWNPASFEVSNDRHGRCHVQVDQAVRSRDGSREPRPSRARRRPLWLPRAQRIGKDHHAECCWVSCLRRRERSRCSGDRCRRVPRTSRSEEHTSELQSPCNLVCRLLLEKKKKRGRDGSISVESRGSRFHRE